jgi:hypothetical protein
MQVLRQAVANLTARSVPLALERQRQSSGSLRQAALKQQLCSKVVFRARAGLAQDWCGGYRLVVQEDTLLDWGW